jgi:hypothetical protein
VFSCALKQVNREGFDSPVHIEVETNNWLTVSKSVVGRVFRWLPRK